MRENGIRIEVGDFSLDPVYYNRVVFWRFVLVLFFFLCDVFL